MKAARVQVRATSRFRLSIHRVSFAYDGFRGLACSTQVVSAGGPGC
jgi:hypothetical protein